MPKDVILFNPVSIVHDRNIGTLSGCMPGSHIRAIYNPNFPWFSDKKKLSCRDAYYFRGRLFQRPPDGIFEGVKALVLFTAQLRTAPVNLVEEAFIRKVPVVAIEEVSQQMLSQGSMNNYILPVDHMMVASEYEKEALLRQGVPSGTIETVGGVFRYIKAVPSRPIPKSGFRLDPERPVATLSLDFLAPNGETPYMRRRILEIISKGLPEEYQFLVKPHPIEKEEGVLKFLKAYAPRAVIVPSRTPIERVLGVTDILFNRGTSQVIIDAIDRDIPVIPVPLGRKTFFDVLAGDVIVKEEGDIQRVITIIRQKGMTIYSGIRERHLAIPPEEAVRNVAARIGEILGKGASPDRQAKWQEMAIFWAWMGYRQRAIGALDRFARTGGGYSDICDAIRKLALCEADHEDRELLKKEINGSYKGHILKSLWINQLYLNKIRLSPEDVSWLGDFPPETNGFHFLRFTVMLGWLYKRSGLAKETSRLAALIKERFGHENSFSGWDGLRARFEHDAKFFIKGMISK